MKCITISAPHAGYFFDSQNMKWVENRKLQHPWHSHCGPLLIHCGKGQQYLSAAELVNHPIGQILGVVDLLTVIHVSYLEQARAADNGQAIVSGTNRTVDDVLDHKHTCGPYCLITANPRKFKKPIYWTGCRGLYDVPDDLVAEAIETAEAVL